MDKEYLQKVVDEDVLGDMSEFLESDSAFFMYVEYEGGDKGVKTVISPAPDQDTIEEVMRKVAQKVYEEAQELPMIVVGCERIAFRKEGDSGDMKDGMIILAMDASQADGFISLYEIDNMSLVSKKDFSLDSEDVPPYTMTAIAAFMHETLEQAELIEKNEHKPDKTDVQFRFSRN